MSNLREWLEELELSTGERVEAVAVGKRRARNDFERQEPVVPIGRDESFGDVRLRVLLRYGEPRSHTPDLCVDELVATALDG